MRIVLAVLLLSFPSVVSAQNYQAEVGSCKKAKNERAAKRAPHLFFSMTDGKKLWAELGTLRKDNRKLKLVDKKLNLQLNIEKLWKMQLEAAEKAIVAQVNQIKELKLEDQRKKKRIEALEVDVRKWNLEAVKYKGERYQFLVWGVVGGVVVTGAVVAVVAYLAFAKPQ